LVTNGTNFNEFFAIIRENSSEFVLFVPLVSFEPKPNRCQATRNGAETVNLALPYTIADGKIAGYTPVARHLRDVYTAFADRQAAAALLAAGDPLLYYVTLIDEQNGPGQLHYALGMLMPGKIGDEYYMTKGHIHAWRPAAEVYIGISGRGMMLLEDETSGECIAVPLEENTIVYVPGNVSHRTINVGNAPLVYWGILSSRAGHDYGAVAQRNFRKVIVERNGAPVVLDRSEYVAHLLQVSNHE
jgi:glucose-6-phosphate isomerase